MKDMMRCAVAVAVVLVAASVGADDIKASVSFGKFGSVDLIQRDGAVQITANLTNLPQGQHGFHVHQYGDIFTNGCTSTGGHFNPDKVIYEPSHYLIFLIFSDKYSNVVVRLRMRSFQVGHWRI